MPVNSLVLVHSWNPVSTRFLREYTLERDLRTSAASGLKSVRDTLKTAWEQHRASVSMGDAWAIRALVKAEGLVWRKLKELNDEIVKLEPQKEVA